MSYGVALRNGIPFTLGTIAALCVNATGQAWSPLALWPTGTEAGMWIDPSNLTSQWQDSTGTTPVATPGTVADSSNPVGLALDLRLGATVLTDPGNHLLQATSTARPLLSARVNLLTYTEDFSNAVWQSGGVTLTPAAAVAPDGTTSAYSCSEGTGTSLHFFLEHQVAYVTGQTYSFSIFAKKVDSKYVRLFSYSGTAEWMAAVFDLDTGLVAATDASGASWSVVSTSVSPAANGFVRLSVTFTSGTLIAADTGFAMSDSAAFGNFGLDPAYSGTSRSVYVWGAQVEYGGDAFDYQSVPGNGSSYPSTGFPIYQKYDGTDDGMATATFAAGTLTSAMDCMIAVRRNSAANAVCGLYNAVADANRVFGIAESGSGSGCVGSGAGTPTVWVDGAQLTGGTAVTRGTLHTALSVGDWHILELRGLDLSTWTAAGSGLYTSYVLNGAQGGILLFPSSTSTADRDAARTWLGAKVGLTL